MDKSADQKQTFDLLDRTLEAFGADAARWPDAARTRLLPLIAGNTEAQQKLAAARALDSVLNFAPKLNDAQNAALADRLVRQASRQPRAVAQSPAAVRSGRGFADRGSQAWVGAALAASLVFGIFAGQTTDLTALSDAFAFGTSDAASLVGQQVAQGDEADTLIDEDLL
jgi:hypothetical protein